MEQTPFFVHKHEIPQDRLKDVTYIKQKKEPPESELLSEATSLTILTMSEPRLLI